MCEKDHCQRPGDVLVRRLIHEQREKAERRMTPSEAFKRYFGPEHGVRAAAARAPWLQAGRVCRREQDVTAPVAWLLVTRSFIPPER